MKVWLPAVLLSLHDEELLVKRSVEQAHITHNHPISDVATATLARMTRDEIGSYLGLKLETVSRLLSRMHRDGLILVQGRVIKLLDTPQLKRLVDTSQ